MVEFGFAMFHLAFGGGFFLLVCVVICLFTMISPRLSTAGFDPSKVAEVRNGVFSLFGLLA